MKTIKAIFITILLGVFLSIHAQEPTTVLTFLPDQETVIYDLQTFTVKKGLQKIFLKNPPYSRDFNSVLFMSRTPWATIRSFGVLKPKTTLLNLLNAHRKEKITVLCPSSQSVSGTLVEWVNSDPLRLFLQTSDHKIMILPLQNDCSLRFEKSENLQGEDFYSQYYIDLEAERAGQVKIAQIFKRDDIDCCMEYFGVLGEDEKQMELSAWFDFRNSSGLTFKNARLKVLIGKPELMSRYEYWLRTEWEVKGSYFSEIPRIDTIKEAQATEFKILEISRPINFFAGQKLKRPYFKERKLSVEKKYFLKFKADGFAKIEAHFIIPNTRQNDLGIILPEGSFTLFKKMDGVPTFLSQTKIENVPANGRISLALGEVMDVEASKVPIKYVKVKGDSEQVTWHIYINNLKDKPIQLQVVDKDFDGRLLEVIRAPSPVKYIDNGIKYSLDVPARQKKLFKLITLEEFSRY